VKKIIQVYKDTLYISKLTNVKRKKTIISLSVVLSQAIALADILVILLFTNILTGDSNILNNLNFLTTILELKIFLPLLILIRYSAQYFQSVLIKDFQLKISNNLRKHIFSSIFEKQNLSIADSFFYINTLSGHIAFFYASISNFLNYLLQSVAFSVYLLTTNPFDIGIYSIVIILLFKPITYLLKKSRESMHQSYEQGKSAFYDIQRVVENLFLIKLLNKQKDELLIFSKRIQIHKEYLLRNHIYGILNSFLPSFITVFILSIIISFFSENFTITVDFVGVTLRMFQALGLLTGSLNNIANSHVHLEKFYELEKTNIPHKYVTSEANKINLSDSAIKLSEVDFKYQSSEEYIFKNLNQTFKKNTHTLLTGPNGSGKSTLLGILAGIYFPEKGFVQAFSNKFGYVGPTPLIFTTSLRNNLLYGVRNKIEDKTLNDYLSILNVFQDKDVFHLEDIISNKALSSGQMQKIAFIRALISGPDILFLDESTSNLDAETKKTIFEILKKNSTTIINSTHDPTSFQNVDNILKIEINEDYNIVKNLKES